MAGAKPASISLNFFPKPQNMFRVTREIDFCYGHRLLNYDGKCRHLHGHNGTAVITIEGPELDNRGMVVDFSDIKKAVSTWIDDNLDHRMLLNRADPVVPILEEMGEPLYLVDENPTAENIAKLIYTETKGLDLAVPIVEVRLWETPKCYATYVPE
ncbi:6-pyruvoyl trahydropterin synthase family protein [Adhaeretor mobilis]|uniref:6-carboxy-5,6,7,8-tetrahydropterin synthase n=1 Tax=Adhaeretor mobilis TaxID=1930276 RepID=A0A517MYC7_9BACT|nr:6-carboxytetrahydropterin synthase [Adhaeretor mobilis]QDS99866.1 6-carboxy-5,6,7,8-tetrahydropterin synthase [Adhaeretor mobilis]